MRFTSILFARGFESSRGWRSEVWFFWVFLLGNHDEVMNEQGYWLADSLFLYYVSLNNYTKGSLTK
jgi:hypothetical protein